MMNEALDQLHQAIEAGDDEKAEHAVLDLAAGDEPQLLIWLGDRSTDRRWWAACALAHCGTAAAIPALAARLTDADPTVRAIAARALGQLHGRVPSAVTPILSALAAQLADESGAVRQAATDALAHCGADALLALAQVLHENHPAARSRAAAAVRKINSPAAVPILFRCLNDPNYLVHTYAYEALDERGLLETTLVIP
jgi:HEAT repeat protein